MKYYEILEEYYLVGPKLLVMVMLRIKFVKRGAELSENIK